MTLRDLRSFGGLLADLREQRGWSQNQLAAEAGYDHSTICRLEKGTRVPSRDTVTHLATALGLDAADTARLYAAGRFLPPGRWVVLDGDADLLIRAAGEASP